jgi:hypothetical protein
MIEDIWGSGGIAPPFLISALDGSGSFHALDTSPSEEIAFGIHWIGGWVGPEPVWTLWRTEKSCSGRKSKPGPPAVHRYTDSLR